MSLSEAIRMKTDQLPVGSRLSHPINDGEGRLLLAAGVLLTKRIKERLLARGIREVLLHPDDAAVILGKGEKVATQVEEKPQAKKKKAAARPREKRESALQQTVAQIKIQATALAASVPVQVQSAGPPLSQSQVRRGTLPYAEKQRERLAQQFSVTTQLIDNIARQAISGQVQDDRLLKVAAQSYISELTDDTDNVIASSFEIAPDPTITERGVRLALLGMAMAIEMDWDEANVREVGHCGLVHDLGMFRFDERLRDPHENLSAEDWTQSLDHPLLTLDMLTSMKNVSLPVRLAATQIHENPDGSGYPRGLKSDEIHPYAALLHVADAYISLTANMRGRKAYLSYDVMVYLLNQVKAKHMEEKAVRALLQAVTLFPIGSRVRLSDGTEAKVIRRNENNYTAPIVQRVGGDRKPRLDSARTSIVDLALAKMRVMSPLVPPERDESRLDESLMSDVLWEG